MFDIFSQIVNDGLLPCLQVYLDFLLNEGLFFGVCILVLPLLGKIVNIIKKFL